MTLAWNDLNVYVETRDKSGRRCKRIISGGNGESFVDLLGSFSKETLLGLEMLCFSQYTFGYLDVTSSHPEPATTHSFTTSPRLKTKLHRVQSSSLLHRVTACGAALKRFTYEFSDCNSISIRFLLRFQLSCCNCLREFAVQLLVSLKVLLELLPRQFPLEFRETTPKFNKNPSS